MIKAQKLLLQPSEDVAAFPDQVRDELGALVIFASGDKDELTRYPAEHNAFADDTTILLLVMADPSRNVLELSDDLKFLSLPPAKQEVVHAVVAMNTERSRYSKGNIKDAIRTMEAVAELRDEAAMKVEQTLKDALRFADRDFPPARALNGA